MRKPLKPRWPTPQKAAPEKSAEQIQASSPAQIEQIKKLALDIASDSKRVQRYAVFALGKMNAKEATRQLTELLNSSDPKIRLSSAYALGKLGADAQEAVTKLTELLKDSNADVRWNAANTLRRIKEKQTGAALKSPHPAVKGLILKIAEPPPVIPRFVYPWSVARLSAIHALGKLGANAKEAVPVLEQLLKISSDHRVRSAAAIALEMITGKEYPVK